MQQIDQKTYVVYVTENGVARRRTVKPGGRADGQVEIVSGLEQGDRLIVSGLQNVFDGQKVEITDTLGS
jgi:membrane fusion protein (multidrug efflux system)